MRSMGKKLWREESGAVASIYALALPALIAVGGIAFDYARLAAMDTELQNAADQAALAAVTQLDGKTGACDRAIAAAKDLLKRTGQTGNASGNFTVFANDNLGPNVTIGTQTGGCSTNAASPVRFYTTAEGNTLATNESDAKFVEVTVVARAARYALTPVVAAFNSGAIDAEARAGLGSAICKVPPLMICNPDPSTPFNADLRQGQGVMVTGHGNTKDGKDVNGNNVGTNYSAWAPGDFGFLEAGTGNNSDLVRALAYQNPNITCLQVNTGQVNTGNPQGLYDAINTRFDIYDFPSQGGSTLAGCFSSGGNCPAAPNTVKDLMNTAPNGGNNQCGIGNNAWRLPSNQFVPNRSTPDSNGNLDTNGSDAMGLPRDNCHYTSFVAAGGAACPTSANGRIGDGNWARGDYFNKYHSSSRPSNWQTITRYNTYLWEITNNNMPYNVPVGGGGSNGGGSNGGGSNGGGSNGGGSGNNLKQFGRPICSTGTIAAGQDRRVLSVAIVENCDQLRGGSRTAIIGEWADMFLVEPTVDGRGNGATKDQIYMEVIGKSRASGNGSVDAQTYFRSAPYLVR